MLQTCYSRSKACSTNEFSFVAAFLSCRIALKVTPLKAFEQTSHISPLVSWVYDRRQYWHWASGKLEVDDASENELESESESDDDSYCFFFLRPLVFAVSVYCLPCLEGGCFFPLFIIFKDTVWPVFIFLGVFAVEVLGLLNAESKFFRHFFASLLSLFFKDCFSSFIYGDPEITFASPRQGAAARTHIRGRISLGETWFDRDGGWISSGEMWFDCDGDWISSGETWFDCASGCEGDSSEISSGASKSVWTVIKGWFAAVTYL